MVIMNAPHVHTAFAFSRLLANKEHRGASAAAEELHAAVTLAMSRSFDH